MRLASKKILKDFCIRHSDARIAAGRWEKLIKGFSFGSQHELAGEGQNMNTLTDGGVDFDLDALSVAWVRFNRIAQLRPLESEADYEHTLALLTQVFDAAANDEEHPLGNLLSLLASMVEAYENVHHSLGDAEPKPHEMLAFMMEQGERTADDLTGILDHAELEAVLAGRRRIDGSLAGKLAALFGVPATLFLPTR